jgi:hypothetical protein
MTPTLNDETLERNADRTLHLRALHGGRIVLAQENTPK